MLYRYREAPIAKTVNWESRIGRRLRLRDLHIFFGVVQWGSMAKAAKELGMSQPTVSEVIADLEHTLGVPLFERSPKGVQLTHYGRALHARAHSAFDELRQGVRDIEFLADPTVGEIRMACPESISAGLLPDVIAGFARDHPRVALHVEQVVTPTFEFPELRARKFDFVIARLRQQATPDDELEIEVLFEEDLVVVAGAQSRWARNPNLELADLIDAPWIYGDKNTWGRDWITEAFRAGGLREPANVLTTLSVHLRFHLAAMGEHVTYIPRLILRVSQERFGLRTLPVPLPSHRWSVGIVTLKQRTLSPVVTLFLDRLRAYVRSNALSRRLDILEVSVPPLA